MAKYDPTKYKFTRPAERIKALNVKAVPQRIFDDMKKYNETSRVFNVYGLEFAGKDGRGGVIVGHRPADAQVAQLYRMSLDADSTGLERLTYFDLGSGRTIQSVVPILGEDWRGTWRAGGALMIMDLIGNENFQLWRYWEDAQSDAPFPKIDGELNNSPGQGRFERVTDDDYTYPRALVSKSNRLLVFASTKENGKDTLIYRTKLIDSNTGAKADSRPFSLPSRRITTKLDKGTTVWLPQSISLDDKKLLITLTKGHSYRPLYVLDISSDEPGTPELIVLPGVTEKVEETAYSFPEWSRDPDKAHILYFITNGYGDFNSVVAYDTVAGTVTHITTPEPNLHALRPISWEATGLLVTPEALLFRANVEGWQKMYAMPLKGTYANQVLDVRLHDWEGSPISYATNARNDKPSELVMRFNSHRMNGFLAYLDLSKEFEKAVRDEQDNLFISVTPKPYRQATPAAPQFKTFEPKLLKFKSFDGLEVPCMYYHPHDRKKVVPVIINIHGGPESQATADTRIPTHGYLVNELGCAVIYPNVRGSTGYGKRYSWMDDVYKREDAVKDIGALLEHIDQNMKNELDSSHLAIMGGSYGGYMVYACLTHFSPKLTCGVANFGISHWPSFLENTADRRRDLRRREYGDESNPDVRAFLERVSPVNNAEKISVPLSIAHGEEDSRVPVGEALRMWDIVSQKVYMELMVCELEGHGFKQKSVIEFVNAAKAYFLERFLQPDASASSNL